MKQKNLVSNLLMGLVVVSLAACGGGGGGGSKPTSTTNNNPTTIVPVPASSPVPASAPTADPTPTQTPTPPANPVKDPGTTSTPPSGPSTSSDPSNPSTPTNPTNPTGPSQTSSTPGITPYTAPGYAPPAFCNGVTTTQTSPSGLGAPSIAVATPDIRWKALGTGTTAMRSMKANRFQRQGNGFQQVVQNVATVAKGQGVTGTGIGGTLSPTDVLTHYNVPAGTTGAGQTIVIVDGPSSGDITSDLTTFDTFYNLPACTTANGCLTITNLGTGAAPPANDDWVLEVSMDVEWAHAIAPQAKIVLIQAASANLSDLWAAMAQAVNVPGVTTVSMSWSTPEFQTEVCPAFDGFFQAHPEIAFFAAAGDAGNTGANQGYPAASPYVTGVGGTTMNSIATPATGQADTVWADGGGGTSLDEAMPLFQTTFMTTTNDPVLGLNATARGIPDVAFNADVDNSPVGIVMKGGWYGAGGSSEGAPAWAAIAAGFAQTTVAAGGNLQSTLIQNSGLNGLLYQVGLFQSSASAFYPVTGGSDGTCAVCSAGPGYDEASGLGVPNVANLFAGY